MKQTKKVKIKVEIETDNIQEVCAERISESDAEFLKGFPGEEFYEDLAENGAEYQNSKISKRLQYEHWSHFNGLFHRTGFLITKHLKVKVTINGKPHPNHPFLLKKVPYYQFIDRKEKEPSFKKGDHIILVGLRDSPGYFGSEFELELPKNEEYDKNNLAFITVGAPEGFCIGDFDWRDFIVGIGEVRKLKLVSEIFGFETDSNTCYSMGPEIFKPEIHKVQSKKSKRKPK